MQYRGSLAQNEAVAQRDEVAVGKPGLSGHRSAHVVSRRAVTFEPDPTSVGQARRVLREVLAETGNADLGDVAELAASEVVTNAVLHAHTRIELTVEVLPERVRVEVRDFNPILPTERNYDSQATTGRGMALVSALSSGRGVVSLGNDGKIVWFDLTTTPGPEPSEDELLATWGDADWDVEARETEDWTLADPTDEAVANRSAWEPDPVDMQLLCVPPTLWLAAREHHDALLRELVLHLAEHDHDTDFAAAGALDLAGADLARGIISTYLMAAVESAAHEGASSSLPEGHPTTLRWIPDAIDLNMSMPPRMAAAFVALQDALDAAERLAGAGRLLVRPGLPEIVAVRDWVCEQVQSQVSGVPASPWPGTAQERFETSVHAGVDPDWDLDVVLASGRGVVAADDANRIIGISEPLAAQLGWQPSELVGRRVVALIPPSLREAHVAGFTRHLTTGEAHALGVPLTLPVLHADGHEIRCRFLVEQAAPRGRRAVYLAWIDAVQPSDGAV